MAEVSPRPGVFCVRSRLTGAASLPAPAFMTWYDDVHIPDLLAAGVPAAWRYEAVSPSSPPGYLVVYKLPDLAFVQSPAFKAVPFGHPSLPGGGPIERFAKFQGWLTAHIQTWTSGSPGQGHAPLLVWEYIQLSDHDTAVKSIDAWYRDGYMADTVSKMPGWRSTSRFETVFAKDSGDDGNSDGDGLKKPAKTQWLTLHEFDHDTTCDSPDLLNAFLLEKIHAPQSVVDVALFRLIKGFGDNKTPWVD